MLLIKWTSGKWKGWVDEIPAGWVLGLGRLNDLVHYCTDGHERLKCLCAIEVLAESIELDYGGEYADRNLEEEIATGRLRIVFTDSQRTKVASIQWSDGEDFFEEADAVMITDEGYEALEGHGKLALHLRRERDPFLRDVKIEDILSKHGKLACEACDFDFAERYGYLGTRFCEVHHIRPLSEGLQRVSKEDLAILCANCHRMIHKTEPLKSIEEFRADHVIF